MTEQDTSEIVHCGGTGFRVRVSDQLVFEHLTWPSLEVLGCIELPYPEGGYGGAQLAISPSCRYAAAILYSGQSETAYEVFALVPEMKHLGGMPYVLGESDLSPPTFSPDERFVALAVAHNAWWTDPDDEDADEDTPATGGLVAWATVYVHPLDECPAFQFELEVDLPEDWLPPEEGTWPEQLEFSGPTVLIVGVPWDEDFAFEMPEPGVPVIVPGPTE